MTPAVVDAANRLSKNRDFRLVLDAKMIEVNELLLSLHAQLDIMAVQNALTQYHALREFGEYVAERANEKLDG